MFPHAQKHLFGLIDTGIDVNTDRRTEILEMFPVPQVRENKAIHMAPFGTEVQTTVMINNCEMMTTKKGDPMLKMKVYDSMGTYQANVFHKPGLDLKYAKEEVVDKYPFIDIVAKVEEFPKGSGKKTLQITNMSVDTDKKRSPDAYLGYLPKCSADMSDIIVEVYLILDTLKEPHRSVALNALKKYWDKFILSPAATRHHHAYLFGLLEHTWGLLRLGYFLTQDRSKDPVSKASALYMKIADNALVTLKAFKESDTGVIPENIRSFENTMSHMYSIMVNMTKQMVNKKTREVDYDFVLAAIIWHDMGKINEYSIEGGINRDPLMGIAEHRVIGPLMFQNFLQEENIVLEDKVYWHYINVMASHHGKVEWGSPAIPATIEGWLVHLVDFLDAGFQGTNK